MPRSDPQKPLVLVLEGHLTEQALADALDRATTDSASNHGPRALVVDCQRMSGYTGDARNLFVKWNREHKKTISRVAIVTQRPMWKLVISAMALASTQEMQAFADLEAAHRWALTAEHRHDRRS